MDEGKCVEQKKVCLESRGGKRGSESRTERKAKLEE